MKDMFFYVIQVLLRHWYIIVPLVIILICSFFVKKKKRLFYKNVKKEMTNKVAVKKIRDKDTLKLYALFGVSLVVFIILYFSNEIIYESIFLNIKTIVKYILMYGAVVFTGLYIIIETRDDNELIKEQLKETYNCEEFSDEYIVSLDKGYKGILKYPEMSPFIKTTKKRVSSIRRGNIQTYRTIKKYDIKMNFEFLKMNSKTCDYISVWKDSKDKEDKYYNEKIEKIMIDNKEIDFRLRMTYDKVCIVAHTKTTSETQMTDRFSIFFYMLETAINVANIIINDENS